MSEIQYCENCKHIVPSMKHKGPDKLIFAVCAASANDIADGIQFISHSFENPLFFCRAERGECGETCPKFEARDE